jgi:hypothetical protein
MDEASQSRFFGHAQVKNAEEDFVETGYVEEDEDLDRKPAARVLQTTIETPSRKQAPAPTVPKHECNQTKIEPDDSAGDNSSEHLEINKSEEDFFENHEEVDRKPAASARQPKKEPDSLE